MGRRQTINGTNSGNGNRHVAEKDTFHSNGETGVSLPSPENMDDSPDESFHTAEEDQASVKGRTGPPLLPLELLRAAELMANSASKLAAEKSVSNKMSIGVGSRQNASINSPDDFARAPVRRRPDHQNSKSVQTGRVRKNRRPKPLSEPSGRDAILRRRLAEASKRNPNVRPPQKRQEKTSR